MSYYSVRVIITIEQDITVEANDEDEALQLVKLDLGDAGQPSAPEYRFFRPRLVGTENDET